MDNHRNRKPAGGGGRIPNWLQDIPSEAGDGTDATVIAPSVYLYESSHEPRSSGRRKQQPDTTVNPSPLRRENIVSPPPPKPPTAVAVPAIYPSLPVVRQSNPVILPPAKRQPSPQYLPPQTTAAKPSPQPASLPIREINHQPPQPPQPTSLPLRNLITTHFSSNCPICPYTTSCPRCELISSYIMQPRHTGRFLAEYLLPISETLTWEEMVAYLNEGILDRIIDSSQEEKKRYMITGDFERVRSVALRRRQVIDGGGKLRMDRWGMLRGD
ncbi:hypothetical protein QBC38DRAFT_360743 [Podospora fimiseda]|uniref:Uncharacterized protein n=1 Tax=Podospora fimiseda TaxID=252190 RepID=A0AAN7GX81_9PEZI|nr:hypothetical protein QBC38DRAFT_360743 [Podospora fimiseda]